MNSAYLASFDLISSSTRSWSVSFFGGLGDALRCVAESGDS
jgi:hypothetical protein